MTTAVVSTVDSTRPEAIAAAFVAALRRVGMAVPVGSAVAYFEALGALGLDDRDRVYWAGRATLVPDREDVSLYDHVFRAFWDGHALIIDDRETSDDSLTVAVDDEDPDAGDGSGDDDAEVITLRYSATEVLGSKDFAAYDAAELAEAHRLMAQMVVVGGRRSSRRRIPTARSAGRPDLRRTVRRAMRTGGEPIERRFTRTGERPRRVVFLLDVSGSMEAYARALIRFAQAAVSGRRRVEVFTLGTRLTRVTRELSTRDPDRALVAATAAVDDWSGGTRLGESLARFNDQWGQRGMARGATVVILSDGWDRGTPELMDEQMGRLARVAHRVVWVNPLKASPGYQPLAQGMAAALPHVDQFIEGHCLDSLEILTGLLAE
ncbi:MAG: vWA domain-containing protein [Acidimicrobiales bacterium]